MSIAKEIFSRIRNIHLHTEQRYESKIIENINSVWGQFIFKDLRRAKYLNNKGYDFTLLGQDIYDRGVDTELPTGHYSYYLLITYKGKYINPFNCNKRIRKVLYDELMRNYIPISGHPIIYTSIYRESISANIFICTHEDNESNNVLRINSIAGDSLLYLYMNMPYLRFNSDKPIQFSRHRVNITHTTEGKNIFTIQFETHIYGITPNIMSYDFVI